MKRTTLLFTMIAGIVYLSMSAYSVAPSRTGTTVLTGCGGSSCHGNKNTATTVNITIKDGSTTISNNQYQPGGKYKITVTGINSSKTQYGFMCFATKGTGQTAGTFSSAPASTQISTVSGVSVIEHTSPISSASGLTVSFDWTAPAAGSGNVKITAYTNAVDGGGTSANDAFNGTDITLSETPTSVASVGKENAVKVYPNPAKDHLNIERGNSTEAYYAYVYDMTGSVLINEYKQTSSASIKISSLPKGVYCLQLVSGDTKQAVVFFKD